MSTNITPLEYRRWLQLLSTTNSSCIAYYGTDNVVIHWYRAGYRFGKHLASGFWIHQYYSSEITRVADSPSPLLVYK